MIGMPEARIILSHAVTYCATAPKSNSAYIAIDAALKDVEEQRAVPVPVHLRDPHTSGGGRMKAGEDYKYPHASEGNFVVQDYMGVDKTYYVPTTNGYESKIKSRIDFWNQCRGENEQG
jgi:putative ATPase